MIDEDLKCYENALFRSEDDRNIEQVEKKNEESDGDSDSDLEYWVFLFSFITFHFF